MNIFWKRMLGGMTSTKKQEKHEAKFVEKMQRYFEIMKSSELAEFNQLQPIVTDSSFKAMRKVLKTRKYKDTEEYRQYRKFEKIGGDSTFKKYLKVLESNELKAFLNFRDSEAYKDLSNNDKLKASEHLQVMKKYEHSPEYKLYLRYFDSYIEKEYFELKKLIVSDDFKERDAFWRNPKRWEGTQERKNNDRYFELLKNRDIRFYLKADVKKFQDHLNHTTTFVDEFDGNTLNASLWDFGFYYSNPKMLTNHSFANEQQANNAGRNVSVRKGILQLATKKEKVLAAAWDAKKGFYEKQFNYTSDVIQTANKFRQKEGYFRAKIRTKGNIQHAFWLSGENKLPHINIFRFNGKQITVGNANENLFDQVKIKGISPSKYYIYTLHWTETELVWYINDLEVFRTSANLPHEPLYLAFNSFIPQGANASEGLLEVDWIKVYGVK